MNEEIFTLNNTINLEIIKKTIWGPIKMFRGQRCLLTKLDDLNSILKGHMIEEKN